MGRVCACVSVSLCVEARLQSFHSGVMCAKFVCMCVCVVPLGETQANSGKWIGMEDLARDSGVKMKEFLHTHRNTLSLSLLLDAVFICATWVSLTHVHMQTQAWNMHNHPPTHSHSCKHTYTDKSKNISNIHNLYLIVIIAIVLDISTPHLAMIQTVMWKYIIQLSVKFTIYFL